MTPKSTKRMAKRESFWSNNPWVDDYLEYCRARNTAFNQWLDAKKLNLFPSLPIKEKKK